MTGSSGQARCGSSEAVAARLAGGQFGDHEADEFVPGVGDRAAPHQPGQDPCDSVSLPVTIPVAVRNRPYPVVRTRRSMSAALTQCFSTRTESLAQLILAARVGDG
jgi:hypothetical protein